MADCRGGCSCFAVSERHLDAEQISSGFVVQEASEEWVHVESVAVAHLRLILAGWDSFSEERSATAVRVRLRWSSK